MSIIAHRVSTVADTERLRIRRLSTDDASFILALVNEPSWIRYIGDRRVRTRDDALRYLQNGPLAMYERTGFGLCAVESKETSEAIGICGLIDRDTLDDVDLGFAFLPAFWRKGYAFEAAAAVVSYGANELGLRRIVAIVSPDNDSSKKLLQKLGFRFEGRIPAEPNAPPLDLYAIAC